MLVLLVYGSFGSTCKEVSNLCFSSLILYRTEAAVPFQWRGQWMHAVGKYPLLEMNMENINMPWSIVHINPLNPELNAICYLLALLGAHYFLHVSRISVKSLTFRLLMSYIYGAPILDVSRSHTTTQQSR